MPATRTRRNIYPGTCTECGEHVAAYDGILTGTKGAWTVEHDRCPAAVEAQRAVEHEAFLAREAAMSPLDKLARGWNDFTARYVHIAETSTDLDDFNAKVRAASQGMTMDYMTEYVREGEAIKFARAVAAERFGA